MYENNLVAEMIPVADIRVVNPRKRNRNTWLAIVASIRNVGLKKPILVSRGTSGEDERAWFHLVCGQGRLEAFKELGEEYIPALLTESSQPDQFLMSLVENIARRPPSNKSIHIEVRNLRTRGYDATAIAHKLGLDKGYIVGIVHLVEHGEAKLIEDVEAGKLPLTVAVEICRNDDDGIQRALAEGYESGELRGSKLTAIRRLIQQRSGRSGSERSNETPKTGAGLVKLYKQRVKDQQRLVARANQARDRLLVIASAMRVLLIDEDFRTLLRAENLSDMPEELQLRST
jgi:ParB family chromosome partitioning protein